MSTDTIEQEFQQKVSKKVRLAAEGVDRYRVFTPFMFEDGDHLAVVLKREGEKWFLSDEGHTYMHVSYALETRSLEGGTRAKIISSALSAFSVEDRSGELVLAIPENRYGDALFSFVQALLKISDVTFLSREHVRSTFMEDFRAFMEEKVPEGRREFDWHDPRHDPDAKYAVDCRVNGTRRPLFVYALLNDGKVKDATIGLLTFEKWGLGFRSMGIFEDQEQVNRKVLARFTDVCERQYSSLAANRDRITRYVQEAISETP